VPGLYPIFLHISRRKAVIIGGGSVAARKAAGLLALGCKSVRAVAPKFVKEFPLEAQQKSGNFEISDLEGSDLVFAATDSASVNDAVIAEAHRRGIWAQRADEQDDEPGDFVSPAVLRCGPITVAISAGGSPALAARLRDILAGIITDDWVKLAEATKRFRPAIKSSGLPISRRREIFHALASDEAAATLQSGGIAALQTWLKQKFNDLPELQLNRRGAP